MLGPILGNGGLPEAFEFLHVGWWILHLDLVDRALSVLSPDLSTACKSRHGHERKECTDHHNCENSLFHLQFPFLCFIENAPDRRQVP